MRYVCCCKKSYCLSRTSLTLSQDKIEKRTVVLKNSDTRINSEVAHERQQRKDAETKIVKNVDERVYQMTVDIARDRRNREESEKRLEQEVGDQILQLQEEIEEERKIR